MTKVFIGAMAAVIGLRPPARGAIADAGSTRPRMANPGLMIEKLAAFKDEVSYWALRAYTRLLKAIGDASELAARGNQEKHR